MTIPKIIHQIAPLDKSRWHPLWDKCHPTWRQCYLDFEHKLWSDQEEIIEFVKENYYDFYQLFLDFPVHIMRVDFIRFCMLHYYGGIYADMDMYCYKNFYNELSHPVMIVEAPYGEEFLESSLMVSEPYNQFWIDCMELSKEKFYGEVKKKNISIPFNNDRASQYIIQSACGPALICKVWRKWLQSDQIKTLPGVLYNNHGMSYHPEYRTRHMMTGMWGKEAIDFITKRSENNLKDTLSNGYIKEVSQYVKLNISNLDVFDFYKDYTNGGYLKSFTIDHERNNTDIDPQTSSFIYN